MAEPLAYTSSQGRRRAIPLALALLFVTLTALVTLATAAQVWEVESRGQYHAGVSFEWRFPLKTYNVQWPAFVWMLPLCGIATGFAAERDGWRRGGRRCWVSSAICAASWLAMDILWR